MQLAKFLSLRAFVLSRFPKIRLFFFSFSAIEWNRKEVANETPKKIIAFHFEICFGFVFVLGFLLLIFVDKTSSYNNNNNNDIQKRDDTICHGKQIQNCKTSQSLSPSIQFNSMEYKFENGKICNLWLTEIEINAKCKQKTFSKLYFL